MFIFPPLCIYKLYHAHNPSSMIKTIQELTFHLISTIDAYTNSKFVYQLKAFS